MRGSIPNVPEATTVRATPLRRLGTRRLARAHVTLSERPQAVRLARQALQGVCEALSQELSCPVRVEARLLEAVVMPLTGLARGAVFALVDLAATGGTGVLELEPPVLLAAMERLSGAETRAAPLTELTRLEEASFAFLALAALAALRAQGEVQRRFSPCLTGVTMDRAEVLARLDARQCHLGVELTVTVGQTTAGGRLVLPAGVIDTALRELPVERDVQVSAEVLLARLEARCRMGNTALTHHALEALGAGDVILFEGLSQRGGRPLGPGRLTLRGLELWGDFTPEGFLLRRAHGHGSLPELDIGLPIS